MEKILITGSNGLLGQKLIYQLLTNGDCEIVATSRGENRLKQKQGYRFVSLDITDPQQVMKVISVEQPDVVIHTAAMTHVDVCEQNREEAYITNVEAVQYLTDACIKNDTFLVHLSTDFIFDGKEGPYDEEALPNPISFYGETKLKAEKIILDSSVKAAIVRTVLVYGITDDMSRSNIVLWVKSALEKGEPIRVVDDQFRTPTLVEDLAIGTLLAAYQKVSGIFNISGKDFMSVYELAEKVANFWGLDCSNMTKVSSDELKQSARRPLKTGFILDKAKRLLGYAPRSFEEGLAVMKTQMENR